LEKATEIGTARVQNAHRLISVLEAHGVRGLPQESDRKFTTHAALIELRKLRDFFHVDWKGLQDRIENRVNTLWQGLVSISAYRKMPGRGNAWFTAITLNDVGASIFSLCGWIRSTKHEIEFQLGGSETTAAPLGGTGFYRRVNLQRVGKRLSVYPGSSVDSASMPNFAAVRCWAADARANWQVWSSG